MHPCPPPWPGRGAPTAACNASRQPEGTSQRQRSTSLVSESIEAWKLTFGRQQAAAVSHLHPGTLCLERYCCKFHSLQMEASPCCGQVATYLQLPLGVAAHWKPTGRGGPMPAAGPAGHQHSFGLVSCD